MLRHLRTTIREQSDCLRWSPQRLTEFRMKSMLKHTALLVSLLAGLHLLVGGFVRTGFIGDGSTATGWIETFFRFVLTPPPTTTLWILALSLSVLVTLSFLERTKRKSSPPLSPPLSPPPYPIPLPRTPRPSIRKEQISRPRRLPGSPHHHQHQGPPRNSRGMEQP